MESAGYPRDVTMYVLSGTGNTRRAATWIASEAAARAIPSRIVPVPAVPDATLPGHPDRLAGLLLPAHGFTAPWAAWRMALRMPRGRGTPAFVLVTRGGTKFGRVFVPGMEGTAAYGIAAVLALKGWRVRGVRGVDMPSNWTSLHPGYGPEAAGAIRDRNRPRVAAFAACLLEGRSCFRSLAPLVIGLALLPISAMYLALGRLFLAKLFFANEDCDLCGICVRHCAFGGVRWKGPGEPRPYWTFHCESCMRCMGYCPRGAVEAGHSLAVALYFLTAIPAGTWILAHAGEALGVPGLAGIAPFARVLDFLYAVLALWLAYGALHALLRFRWARWLLARTTFTHLYRRYHEHGTSLGSLGREEST